MALRLAKDFISRTPIGAFAEEGSGALAGRNPSRGTGPLEICTGSLTDARRNPLDERNEKKTTEMLAINKPIEIPVLLITLIKYHETLKVIQGPHLTGLKRLQAGLKSALPEQANPPWHG